MGALLAASVTDGLPAAIPGPKAFFARTRFVTISSGCGTLGAPRSGMTALGSFLAPVIGALACLAGCYRAEPEYSTFPEPTVVAGPPGGEIDPAWTQHQYSDHPGYPDGYPAGYPAGTEQVAMQTAGDLTPSADPSAAGYVMGAPNDTEIATALSPYGEWIEVEGYGFVWRPYATVVGLDFTPYESCGTWVWTDDWGWTFACEWDWGWLPFHYGRWGWFDDAWAWEPGYEWSPAWVEWRSGGGYVGWRPLAPTGSRPGGWQIRDHRTGSSGTWAVHDERPPRLAKPKLFDSQWRFTAQIDFGKRVRPNVVKAPAEGLRVTKLATRPPMRGTTQPVSAAAVMRGRIGVIAATRAAQQPVRPQATRSERSPVLRRIPERERSFDVPSRPSHAPSRSFDPPSRSPSRSIDPPRSSDTWTRSRPEPTHSSSSKKDKDDDSRPSRSSSGGNWSPPSRSSSPSHSPSRDSGSFGSGGGGRGDGRGHRR